ncbi:hypothetical protein CLOSTHATH_07147 [Hungatella hathewayi DSM 13479]|uniref:Uncharacterized protein n=1 Tax=Hungatella hathewayi DSM 13479 TaxID=566550 RepID=D3AU33_9FIRM|nr:hypothetical protein CLOSTHATH_07147 [Hungatella hathewayi DSM 13479]
MILPSSAFHRGSHVDSLSDKQKRRSARPLRISKRLCLPCLQVILFT